MATTVTAMRPDPSPDHGGYRHEALIYGDVDEYVRSVSAFVREGLAAGEPVLVAVPGDRLTVLQAALGRVPGDLRWADMDEVGRNPARLIAAWSAFVDDAAGARARGVGEPNHAGRDDAELDECRRHEHLLDTWFDGRPFTLLCPYDRSLGPEIVDDARATHRGLRGAGEATASPDYRADGMLDGFFDGALSPRPADAHERSFDENDLHALRWFVEHEGRAAGLPPDRSTDLVLAVDEIAANSLTHGGGGGTVRCWTDRGRFLCELSGGGTLDDTRVGRVRPSPERTGGRGLWLANQFCDLVQLRNRRDGLVVRLRCDLRSS